MSKMLREDLLYASNWFKAALAVWMFVLILVFIPQYSEPPGPTYLDKVGHTAAFMLLMVMFCGPLQRRYHWRVFLFLLACGALIELIQIPVPGRSAEAADFLADFAGLSVGWVMMISLGLRDWCLQFEKRLGRP